MKSIRKSLRNIIFCVSKKEKNPKIGENFVEVKYSRTKNGKASKMEKIKDHIDRKRKREKVDQWGLGTMNIYCVK